MPVARQVSGTHAGHFSGCYLACLCLGTDYHRYRMNQVAVPINKPESVFRIVCDEHIAGRLAQLLDAKSVKTVGDSRFIQHRVRRLVPMAKVRCKGWGFRVHGGCHACR